MKQLFLITDTFPPQFAPRMGYLCKYLSRETDWRVICLHEEVDFTSHPAVFGALTEFVQKEYTFVKDEYAHRFTFLQGLHRFLKGQFSFVQFFVFAVSKFLVHLRFRGWDYTAHRLVRKILRENKIDLILGSTGGGSVTKIADYAGKASGLPVIQDIRDLAEELDPKSCLSDCRQRKFIRDRNACFHHASVVSGCVRNWVPYLKTFNQNVALIYNGYDPDVFHEISPNPTAQFTIAYVGSVYSHFSIQEMFKGVALFLRRKEVDLTNVRFSFYSSESTYQRHIVPYMIDQRVKAICFREKSLPQADLVKKFANVSLFMHAASHVSQHALGAISTKLFEYFAVNRPVLSVSPFGSLEAENLICDLKAGCVAKTAEDVDRVLKNKYEEWKLQGFTSGHVDLDRVRLFSREVSAQQFVGLMNKLVLHG